MAAPGLQTDACAAAELRVPEYLVRRYLERSPQAPLSLRQVDPLIRELTQYRRPDPTTASTSEASHHDLIELNSFLCATGA